MKGLRTVGFNVLAVMIVAPVLRWVESQGIDLMGQSPDAITLELLALGNIVLRKFTDTPLGMSAAPQVAPEPVTLEAAAPARLTAGELQALGPMLYDVLAREQSARRAAKETAP